MHLEKTDVIEVVAGTKRLKGTIKRAAQIGGALELETAGLEKLRESLRLLTDTLRIGAEGTVIPRDELYAARCAIRLRFGQLKKLEGAELDAGIEPNPELAQALDRLNTLARMAGIQLDWTVQKNEDEGEGEGEGEGAGPLDGNS